MQLYLNNQSRYNCDKCTNRCDDHSKSAYIFEEDVAFSAKAEDYLFNHLINLGLTVKKEPSQRHGLPDIAIVRDNDVIGRLEVKAQRRAFMSIETKLPYARLHPYEALALNLSDLERYIELYKNEKLPIFIIWYVKRECIGEGYWGQSIDILNDIYLKYGNKRRFQRKTTKSDIIDGEHKGVTVNYHFSLNELLPIDEIDKKLIKL